MTFYYRTTYRVPFHVILCLLLFTIGCDDSGIADSNSGTGQEDTDEVVIDSRTVIINSDEAQIEQEEGNLIIDFNDEVKDIEPGDILVSDQGEGILKRITSVESDADIVTAGVEQAALVDAIERGSFSETLNFENASPNLQVDSSRWKATYTANGVTPKSGVLGIELEDVLFDEQGFEVAFTDGNASFSPEVDLSASIVDNSIEDLRFVTSGEMVFDLELEARAFGSVSEEKEITLAKFSAPAYTFLVGPVPVVITQDIEFVGGVEVSYEQEGIIETGLQSSRSITLGADYSESNWSPVINHDPNLESTGFSWDAVASTEAKAYVKPEISTRLYSVAGPLINFGPHARAGLEVSTDSWGWETHAGVDASFGGTVEILDYSLARYEHTFNIAEVGLESDSGDRSNATRVEGSVVSPEGEEVADMRLAHVGIGVNIRQQMS